MAMLRRLPQDPALHPRHGAGRARLFPDAAVLAGAAPTTTSTTWSASLVDRYAAGAQRLARRAPRRRRSSIPRSASITRACAGRIATTRAELPAPAEPQGDGRPADAALLRAGRRHRALRRRHRGARGARPAASIPAFASGLDSRPAIEAFFRTRRRATVDALVSLTGFSPGRRPGLQRRARGRGHAGRARRALPRRAPARVPDARAVGRAAPAACCRSRRR